MDLTHSGGTTPIQSKATVGPLPAIQRYLRTSHGELTAELSALGLSGSDAERCLDLAGREFSDITLQLGSGVLSSSDQAGQMSILLRRFNVERLAEALSVTVAVAQSAVALLVLDLVAYAAPFQRQASPMPQ